MASVCVNNVTISQEFPTYGCFNPRASFSREDGGRTSGSAASEIPKEETAVGAGDFEFRLEEDPVGMLPADELFSDGKLVTKQQQRTVETGGKCRRMEVVEMEIAGGGDICSFSPKAPRCSSRWRDLLGLKRFSQNSKAASTTIPSNPRSSTSSLKQFLHRSSRSSSSSGSSSSDASLLMSLPLLKDSDCESISISSSRMSLSSSSSGHDHEDIPRLSLDAERPNHNHNLNHNLTANPFAPARSLNPNPPRMRLVNHSSAGTGGGRVGRSPMRRSGGETSQTSAITSRGVSVDSPRLNSSGKIVFQSLERSSSSPSSFNGGTSGYRHRGMERSYSSNVRVTPVLNVPVCSIRGGSVVFGQFFSSSSQHNKTGNVNNNNNRASSHISRGRNSTDRI
ncbi:unnamed protein product [Arabidopsis lyrata]|uniref:uncharacterized protein LOC9323830 n=1 Tax=Arabidopsis lyrata subsp. lyrata TaxID=81972 RepID=UPI000A29A709|nr:uncharacterized protein LOC9323830 [Arabidopsis lyrata subsp. lyrata]CAH8258641.1 unnamed protein product [Arabidopsis lyrata]|eukprot:XP_020891706.1 uncharacterized protein LOC9323830 [Arabidopsis lyrata subsp. lyrata]